MTCQNCCHSLTALQLLMKLSWLQMALSLELLFAGVSGYWRAIKVYAALYFFAPGKLPYTRTGLVRNEPREHNQCAFFQVLKAFWMPYLLSVLIACEVHSEDNSRIIHCNLGCSSAASNITCYHPESVLKPRLPIQYVVPRTVELFPHNCFVFVCYRLTP